MTQSIFQLMFVKAFGRIPSRRPGYCDKKSRGSAAAMFQLSIFIWRNLGDYPAEGRTFLRTLRNLKPCVYVFFDTFSRFFPWPYFSISKEVLTFAVNKMQP